MKSAAFPAAVAGLTWLLLWSLAIPSPAAEDAFELQLRSRAATSPKSPRFHTRVEAQQWQGAQTAVIVCDMWDLHHCLNATHRVAELAPRMNRFLNEARSRGALIIHAPSSCMRFYADHPARKRAEAIPLADPLPAEIGKWCYKIPQEEQGTYPIDQSDGGEDDDPEEHRKWAEELKGRGLNPRAPWTRQIEELRIDAEKDLISDRGEEIWSALEQRQVRNVMLLGVHTNMCVLGRPFGLRNLARNGKNVVLVRDLTDTMYNPAREPRVSHFTGTDLIVEHIEKWVCPTITSDQVLGGDTFRFAADKRPHVVIVMAEREYKTNESLPEFALRQLGRQYRVSLVFANDNERNDLPGIDVLQEADVLLLSVRRRVLPPGQMEIVRSFLKQGKPIVGIRTANHAFSLNGKQPPQGTVAWGKFDQEIFGGNYHGHHGSGPQVEVSLADAAKAHPILQGVDVAALAGHGSLYQVSPLAKTAKPLLVGQIPGKPPEPLAWVNKTLFGGRAFYTSLGHVDDFENVAVQRLLRNAIDWAVAQ